VTLVAALLGTDAAGAQLPTYGELAGQDLPYSEILREGYRSRGSASVGTTLTGRLRGGSALAVEGPGHRVLPGCRDRGTNHGTDELVQLVVEASAAVMAAAAGPRVGVCNLSREGGGSIPWSQSHNSGRDADLAFFVRDLTTQEPVDAPRLMVFNGRGVAFAEEPRYAFDEARNWLLVRALLTHPAVVVQWILVDRRLKRRLLTHARRLDEPAWLLDRAEKVLHQPSDAHRHNDHFHVRIYCSWDDRAEGCLDAEPLWPWRGVDPLPLMRRTAALSYGLRDPDRRVRLAVLEHLTEMEGHGASPALAEMAILDTDHRLRGKAGSLLLAWRQRDAAVVDAIARFIRAPGGGLLGDQPGFVGPPAESQPGFVGPPAERAPREGATVGPWDIGQGRERSANHLYRAYKLLAKLGSAHAVPFVAEALGSGRWVGDASPGAKGVPEARLAARVAIHLMDLALVPALLDHLTHPAPRVRVTVELALRRITNHVQRGSWGGKRSHRQLVRQAQRWRAWWAEHEGWTRDALLQDGFARRGVRLPVLDSKGNIRRLIGLTGRTDEIGYNADRLLVRITRRVTPRGAAAADKLRRWRRWFPETATAARQAHVGP